MKFLKNKCLITKLGVCTSTDRTVGTNFTYNNVKKNIMIAIA